MLREGDGSRIDIKMIRELQTRYEWLQRQRSSGQHIEGDRMVDGQRQREIARRGSYRGQAAVVEAPAQTSRPGRDEPSDREPEQQEPADVEAGRRRSNKAEQDVHTLAPSWPDRISR